MVDQQPAPSEELAQASNTAQAILSNVHEVIVGNAGPVAHLVTALLGGGHILLEDVPGVGKTMLARAIAESFDCSFKRIQFTPDLLPADITGSNVFNQETAEFEFRSGPIFTNILLADEINRAPPKTQAALLEAMEEKQVTVDGETRSLPDPFVVIATQNSIERERTYELPAAELDRFMLKLQLGYPAVDEESTVIERGIGTHVIETVKPVADLDAFRKARSATASVTVRSPIRSYVARLAAYTREQAELGVSPRASIALVKAAQGQAILNSRTYVIPDDIQKTAPAVFPHRMQTAPDESAPEMIVKNAIDSTPVEILDE